MRRLVDHDPITGITTWHEYDHSTKETHIHTTYADAPIDAVLDLNKAMANENAGWSKTKEWRRVGSIPNALIHKWLVEEHIDVFDPNDWPKVKQRLNSSEWMYLRSAHWQV